MIKIPGIWRNTTLLVGFYLSLTPASAPNERPLSIYISKVVIPTSTRIQFTDGALVALFENRYRLQRLETDEPKLKLEHILADI